MAATLNTTVIQNASSSTANITLDTAGNVTGGANLVAAGMPYGSSSFLRNRIINGNMVIDQRNNGASVSTSTANVVTYTLDRWAYLVAVASKFTIQQNAGSVTLPTGFSNYLGCTSTSSYSVGSTEYFLLEQIIEGYNIADFAWGTSNAKSVTLSFQVYSSLTGTFGGSIQNNDSTRSYPFTYTISSANTWTTISVTIPGCPNGTWQSTNSAGMRIYFGLGAGATYSGPAGSWASTNYIAATGAVSVVGTSGATFYITGVQLEQGSVATPFERPLYSKQLADCQRYCQVLNTVAIGRTTSSSVIGASFVTSTQFRVAPTASNITYTISNGSTGTTATYGASVNGVEFYNSASNWSVAALLQVTATLSAEL